MVICGEESNVGVWDFPLCLYAISPENRSLTKLMTCMLMLIFALFIYA